MIEEYIRQGYDVTFDQEFVLVRKPQPEVKDLNSELQRYFLRGIPVKSKYTANINWDGGASSGVAKLILGSSKTVTMEVNASGATYDLDVGSMGAGQFPVGVRAEIEGRADERQGLGTLTIVQPPAWADIFQFKANKQGDHVFYKGEYKLPEKPLDAHVSIPSLVPYVGGAWGILPSQIKVGLTANSSGVREKDQVSAQGGFGLGNRKFTLAAKGNVYTTIQPDDMLFESEQATLSTSGVFYQERLGLVSLVPGASALLNVPVIGNLLQALNAAFAISGDVHGAMSGRGRLGVRGDKLEITEGGFNAGLGVRAAAGISVVAAWAQVSGGGEGSLDMDLIPAAKVNSCQILLHFQAAAGAFGYQVGPIQGQHPLVSCAPAALQTQAFLPRPVMRYGQSDFISHEQAVTHTTNGDIITETVLVENASLQAQPQLAAGPDGRLALVWNSLTNTGAADAVSLRLFDGETWGDAIRLNQLGRPSFNPTVAFDDQGHVLAAWSEALSQPDPDGLTETFARSLEIAWARVDADSGQIVERERLTDNNDLDFGPKLNVARDGSVWLAWQQSPSASLVGTIASPNRLLTTTWADGWPQPETVTADLAGTLFWKLAAVNSDNAWLVADQDTDGDLSTAVDREIIFAKHMASGWSPVSSLTDNQVNDTAPLLAIDASGQPVIAWLQEDAVMGLVGDPFSSQPGVWFDADSGIGPMLSNGELLTANNDELILLWPEGTAQGQDIWLSHRSILSQTWSRAEPIFKDAKQRQSPTAVMVAGNDILLGQTVAGIEEEQMDFESGTTSVPVVDDLAQLTLTRIPTGFLPSAQHPTIYLPIQSN
ncbi:MAG: hypothetical protein J5I90_03335 [Caldilineales bacterium]|nr:hypothetical protein [Caldilineales bacterium]